MAASMRKTGENQNSVVVIWIRPKFGRVTPISMKWNLATVLSKKLNTGGQDHASLVAVSKSVKNGKKKPFWGVFGA